MRSLNASALNVNPTLRVWFSDIEPEVADISDINGRFAAPNLLSAWQLLPGYEWRAEIGLTKRKFILSSFFRDVIAGNFPVYLTVNLRPINARSYVGCEVIEEYRDSSPFDILGSIGGLLALVQGIYMWLFGRPLLWGLTGAKAISPFGLVGECSRPCFRKKLREHYQLQTGGIQGLPTTQEYEERIRMTAFLLDYVLDMGPAGPPEQH
ncbi:deuterolysin metalloprotease (M35) family containing protein [Ceratobasidium sp. AG-Ba]|nr:deuterolysin metalloprotease (M35) family containing protein [Ceratobasidium sp. AG-Ba]QRW09365.1 deuterolysin metalloprotease (M35) family containing protein [Ceratobasidium sp. AG-Ba]